MQYAALQKQPYSISSPRQHHKDIVITALCANSYTSSTLDLAHLIYNSYPERSKYLTIRYCRVTIGALLKSILMI
jgi:hypothetical protein